MENVAFVENLRTAIGKVSAAFSLDGEHRPDLGSMDAEAAGDIG